MFIIANPFLLLNLQTLIPALLPDKTYRYFYLLNYHTAINIKMQEPEVTTEDANGHSPQSRLPYLFHRKFSKKHFKGIFTVIGA